MHTGVVRPRGVNMGNHWLIGAEIEGCQIRDWNVGKRDVIFTNFIHDMCEWRLINV